MFDNELQQFASLPRADELLTAFSMLRPEIRDVLVNIAISLANTPAYLLEDTSCPE